MRLIRTVLAVFVLTACSSDPAPTAAPAKACVPGRTVECPCPGTTGAQTCDDDGTGYGACACPVAPVGGAGGAGGKVSAGKAGETASGGAGAAGMAVAAGGAGQGGAAAGMAGAGGETAGQAGAAAGQAGAGGEAGAGGGGAAGAPCVANLPCECGAGFGACVSGVCECARSTQPALPARTCAGFAETGLSAAQAMEKVKTSCFEHPAREECHVLGEADLKSGSWGAKFCADDGAAPMPQATLGNGPSALYVVCCKPEAEGVGVCTQPKTPNPKHFCACPESLSGFTFCPDVLGPLACECYYSPRGEAPPSAPCATVAPKDPSLKFTCDGMKATPLCVVTEQHKQDEAFASRFCKPLNASGFPATDGKTYVAACCKPPLL